ncbi:MAG: ABC transporter permease [Planctomycetes bacterium]|nr:ABC transporter permease [Planctomycetota bacterium]
MTKARLLLRTIWHFRHADLATMLGIAVGTAVFAGSLIVGSSVRESLRDIVAARLGDVDYVLRSPHVFDQSLAGRMNRAKGFEAGFARVEALLHTSGSGANADSSAWAPRVHVFGRDGIQAGTCIVSEPLAEAIGVAPGKPVIIRVRPIGRTVFDVPFGQRGQDVISLRLKVERVAKKTEVEGAFSFVCSQRPVRNVWVPLKELQEAVGCTGGANTLFVSARDHTSSDDGLQKLLKESASLQDYGLRLVSLHNTGLSLESDSIFLNQETEQAARADPHAEPVLVYLANTIRDLRSDQECPYSMAAGMETVEGRPLGPDEIFLNQWTAEELGAKAGDEIELAYSVRGPKGMLVEKRTKFTMAKVLPMTGVGADRSLVPQFKGITDAETMGKWDPPPDFEFKASRIRKDDEDYWESYRAAPKAFIALETARKLWGTPAGSATSIRFPPGAKKEALAKELLERISPASMGLVFRPIRRQQLQAAGGNTDFGQLFMGFSFFLIISAALLVVLLLRLSVEQRERHIGIMLAQGFTDRAILRLLLGEGLILLLPGALIGVLLAIGYSLLMMIGLRTVWHDAVGTTLLTLHLAAGSLAGGFIAGLTVGALAVWRGVRRFRRGSIAEILAGGTQLRERRVAGRRNRLAAGALFVVAIMAVTLATLSDSIRPEIAFFIAGACVLAALLLSFRAAMRRPSRRRDDGPHRLNALAFAIRNAARNPSRSMLTVSMLASAYFILFAVGSMKTQGASVSLDRHGGVGGYRLIAEFDVPLPYDISTKEGRRYLAVKTDDEGLWDRVQIVNMRASSGEDASCRNLYRPSTPKILSVPDVMIADGRFSFSPRIKDVENPWKLLKSGAGEGIPVIADSESAQWIMKKGIGDTMDVFDEKGKGKKLRIVALLKKSMFQGVVLMADANFHLLFPSRTGYQTLLIDASQADAEKVRRIILRDLRDFGATVETTRERLDSFFRIANSYISAFEMLGGLGVVLGSVGLLVVLMRGVVERRNEFALLSAVGFKRKRVVALVLAENGLLLAAGVAIGVGSALFATFPQVSKDLGQIDLVPMTAALLTLALSFILFLCSASWVVRVVTPAALRRE